MSRVTITASLFVVLVFCLAVAIVLFSPAIILTPIARSNMAELGFDLTELKIHRLGLNSARFDRIILADNDMALTLSDVEVNYSLANLLDGRIESLRVTELVVSLNRRTESPANLDTPPTLESLFQSFDKLPLDSMSLAKITIISDDDNDDSYELNLSLQSPPLQLSGVFRTNYLENARSEFEIRRTETNRIHSTANLTVLGNIAVQSNLIAEFSGDAVLVDGTSIFFIDELPLLLGWDLLPIATVLNDTLTVHSTFRLNDILGAVSIPSLSLSLDNPSSILYMGQESDLASNNLQLRLPITIEGNAGGFNSDLSLTLSEIYGSGNWNQNNAQFQAESHFDETKVNCSSLSDCDIVSTWQYNLLNWKFENYFGNNLSLNAILDFNYSNNEMRLATDLVQLAIPSINTTTDEAAVDRSVQIELEDVKLRVGDIITAGFNFRSREFYPALGFTELKNPAFSGKFQFEEDTLTGILELDLDESLRIGVGLQHFFSRDTGDVVLELGAYSFSDSQPLSSLLTLAPFNADIVGGNIAALANISWSKQSDQSWLFGGPITFKLENLSGYFGESYFIDLSTNFFAEATTPLGVRIANPIEATLAHIDVGLPITNTSWKYRFDTQSRRLNISDFCTSLLDGNLSVPSFDYDPARKLNDAAVVLSDINVESIVNLAEYPGLRVDGYISGYLPLVLEDNKITIEQGLVGALNPGGNIRYTPSSSVPSSNSGLQLVNDALLNYQYQTMNTEVYYDTDGELLLKVQLQGSNPDMNNGQDINLDVNITDNIPSLLKSLQTNRIITDELERFGFRLSI